MDRHERKLKKDCAEEADPHLLAHLRSLGLSTVEEYIAWCGQHGFGRGTNKNWRVRLKERSYANRAIAEARLAQKKQEIRKPEKVIDRIFSGDLNEHDVSQPHLKKISRACKVTSLRNKSAHVLLKHISKCSKLVSDQLAIPQYGWQAGNTFIDGLMALARHSQNWIRPVADWKPQTHNNHRQFASLARHLLAEWPIPSFMNSVWFFGDGQEAERRQYWFLHLGRGQNIRTADLPLPYTKRMAHHFMSAPGDFTVEAALRWGQIRGLGGTERLVRVVIGTRLGNDFQNNEFWTTVLQCFIANPMLDPAKIGPIIDFIHQQRFVSEDVFVAPGVVERKSPPQPNFTMRGRSPASLLRQVDAWHRTLAKIDQPKADWPGSEIEPFQFVEGAEKGGNLKIWTITELLSTKALFAEGRKMKHCVASYASSCARGICSIWTLEVETFEGKSKILTVEVRNASRMIVQARGMRNVLPGEKHLGILRRWGETTRLSLAKQV
jgi:PcfJ-like protein